MFVVIGGGRKRKVQHGFVADYCDATSLFLIEFSDTPPAGRTSVQDLGEFKLEAPRKKGKALRDTRPGQSHFSFLVFSRYGGQCTLCPVALKELLEGPLTSAPSRRGEATTPGTASSFAGTTTRLSTLELSPSTPSRPKFSGGLGSAPRS